MRKYTYNLQPPWKGRCKFSNGKYKIGIKGLPIRGVLLLKSKKNI